MIKLAKGTIKAIHSAIDRIYDNAKARILGPQSAPKGIKFTVNREMTLPGLFEAAAETEGVRPNTDALDHLLEVAEGYIDAAKARTKAQTIQAVQSTLNEAQLGGIDTDLKTVLGGKLQDVFDNATTLMHAISDSEASTAKNVSIQEAIVRINASQGRSDPVVFFVVVRDDRTCDECKTLHLMGDGTTPRCWYLSELEQGYHKKGSGSPSVKGLHPHCRCTLVTLLDGYGFDGGGHVTYISSKHSEIKKQRGEG